MMTAIKAIETKWKGYRFRSRLEARWAVFFTALHMEFEYEPEGFHTDLGWYLPDFFMSHNSHRGPYVEIKAREFRKIEIQKLEEICIGKGAYGLAIWGSPGKHNFIEIHKEGGASPREEANDAQTFLTALNPTFRTDDFQRALQFGVHCARSARFEHGDYPLSGV